MMLTPVSPVAPLSAGPLPLAEFWADLRFSSCLPDLDGGTVQNGTGSGEVLLATVGPRLWRWTVQLAAKPGRDADVMAGRLALLSQGELNFLASPPFGAFPAADPAGSLLGAAVPVIASLPAGGRTLTISGLPAGYVLTAGDWLAFTRGSPARYELHRLVTGGVASGGGVTGQMQVAPALRPGVVVGAAVTLIRPVMRAIIVPGSLKAETRTHGTSAGASFQVMQTLRK